MNYNMYSIYDNVTQQYGSPVLYVNDAAAIRWFSNLCRKDKDIKNDLILYRLGIIDLSHGDISSTVEPIFYGEGISTEVGD